MHTEEIGAGTQTCCESILTFSVSCSFMCLRKIPASCVNTGGHLAYSCRTRSCRPLGRRRSCTAPGRTTFATEPALSYSRRSCSKLRRRTSARLGGPASPHASRKSCQRTSTCRQSPSQQSRHRFGVPGRPALQSTPADVPRRHRKPA